MKVPDLHDLEMAGVHGWKGDMDALMSAAAAAKFRYRSADLKSVGTKTEMLAALGKALDLPEHFGQNWDALADSVEDEDWLGRNGVVITLSHTSAFRKAHGIDWTTLEDIFAEASDYWRERHKPFWVFVS